MEGVSAELSVRHAREAVEYAVVERAVSLGARRVVGVHDEHGWRRGRIEDPFRHHWEVGKPLVPWPPPG